MRRKEFHDQVPYGFDKTACNRDERSREQNVNDARCKRRNHFRTYNIRDTNTKLNV